MAETAWLFSQYVPPVLLQLQQWMKQCISIFDQTHGDSTHQARKSFVLKSKDVDNLSGVVILRRDVIVKATVKVGRVSSRSAKQEVKYEMLKQKPFYIRQLEETLSNLKAALRITESRQGHLVDIHDAVEFTKLLLGYLQKAYKCLMVPPDNMKQLWEMKSRVAFRPQLANSELITFAIDSSKLVLSFYAMSAISASLQDPRRNTVEIGSQLYEISQHHRVCY
jgi:hypothetical protein